MGRGRSALVRCAGFVVFAEMPCGKDGEIVGGEDGIACLAEKMHPEEDSGGEGEEKDIFGGEQLDAEKISVFDG